MKSRLFGNLEISNNTVIPDNPRFFILFKMHCSERNCLMNDFVSELLDGIKTGDRVRVRVGTGSSQEIIEGTIEKWSDYLLFLRKTDGGLAKIALDDLRMIDPV